MTRAATLLSLAFAFTLGLPALGQAQVDVRAPFVRVQVGPGGVHVRAPFVNLFVPRTTPRMVPPGYVPPGSLPPGYVPQQQFPGQIQPGQVVPGQVVPQQPSVQPKTNPSDTVLPAPRVDPNKSSSAPPNPDRNNVGVQPTPPPATATPPAAQNNFRYPTVDEFIRNFQPREGNYEVSLINPVTGTPATIQFTLPEGRPEVLVGENEVEFDYGLGRSIRIAFTPEGAFVTRR